MKDAPSLLENEHSNTGSESKTGEHTSNAKGITLRHTRAVLLPSLGVSRSLYDMCGIYKVWSACYSQYANSHRLIVGKLALKCNILVISVGFCERIGLSVVQSMVESQIYIDRS